MEELVPTGWQIASIAEVTLPIEKTDPSTNPNQMIDYLDISGIDNKTNRIVEAKHYLGKDAPSRARQIIKHKDILFSTVRTYLKNIAMVPEEYDGQVASTGFSILRAAEGINSKFLFYYTLTQDFLNPLTELQRGSSYPAVRDDDVRIQKISLPPLNEQKRIVAKIEVLFSELDKGIESLKAAREQLRVYRQAVLKDAFEGKLTAQWREQNRDKLETADQLLTRMQVKRFEGDNLGTLPSSWVWLRSGELFSMVTSGSRGWAKYYSDSGALFIRIGNLDFDSLSLDLSDLQHVSLPGNAEGLRTRVLEGDFLFSITGYLGMFAIAPKLEEAYVNQHIALAHPFDGFNHEYVGYYITSHTGGRYYLNGLTKGAVKAGLRLDDIRSFPVPMCSLAEQEKVVEVIKKKLSVIENFEQTIAAELQKSEALRQSILKKACSGKLVARDPNDEPASVLLERIRAERATIRQEKAQSKTEGFLMYSS